MAQNMNMYSMNENHTQAAMQQSQQSQAARTNGKQRQARTANHELNSQTLSATQ